MKMNPWTFGGLFLLVSGIWMYHNFELPKFYPFEKTGKVGAVVFQSRPVPPRLPSFGRPNDQIAKFVYMVDDVVYVSEHRAYKVGQFQKSGDSLLIEYSISNPQRTKPLIYYRNVMGKPWDLQLKKAFLHTKSKGYKSLEVRENIFTYEDYAEYGKCLVKVTGTYTQENAIIRLTPLIYYENTLVENIEVEEPKAIHKDLEPVLLSDFRENDDGTVVEINSNLVFEVADGKK